MSRHLRAAIFTVTVLALGPANAAADVVLDWNRIMLATIAGQNPFAQARFAAIVQLAVFEAVNGCRREYEPYLGTVEAPFGASAEAAAIAAAHGVLEAYFPAAAATLDAARDQSLAALPDGYRTQAGIAVGEAAAAAMVLARADDGSVPPGTFLPGTAEPGTWQPTPTAFGPGLLLHWRNLTPFGTESNDQFRSPPPPPLTSRQYARDYNEVMAVGSVDSVRRPADRTDVARFFAVVGAPYAWNTAAQQVSVAERFSLSRNARAFALLNMAISDGLAASMETKYHYTFWRPVTAIRAGHADDNPRTDPDGGWTPLVTTPSFPSYPSAHASASYAARRVAEALFGAGRHRFVLTHDGVPGVTLTYRSFRALTEDIDDARVYGGIHFRFDQEAGAKQGRRIGRFVATHRLQPLRGRDR